MQYIIYTFIVELIRLEKLGNCIDDSYKVMICSVKYHNLLIVQEFVKNKQGLFNGTLQGIRNERRRGSNVDGKRRDVLFYLSSLCFLSFPHFLANCYLIIGLRLWLELTDFRAIFA